MAESSKRVEMVSPLYSPGIHHAQVRSWEYGTPADPLGVLDPIGNQARPLISGGGDDVSEWKEEFPGGGQ